MYSFPGHANISSNYQGYYWEEGSPLMDERRTQWTWETGQLSHWNPINLMHSQVDFCGPGPLANQACLEIFPGCVVQKCSSSAHQQDGGWLANWSCSLLLSCPQSEQLLAKGDPYTTGCLTLDLKQWGQETRKSFTTRSQNQHFLPVRWLFKWFFE